MVFVLLFGVLALALTGVSSSPTRDTVHVDGEEYVPPTGWRVALLGDNVWVFGTSDTVYESFDTQDVVAYGDASRTAYVESLYPDVQSVYAPSVAAWLTAVTNLTLARGGTYRGVQWAITGNKGVSGTRVRLWFIPPGVVVNIDQYWANTWISTRPRIDLTTFENWVYSGVLLWCSGASSCGSINATVGQVTGSSNLRVRLREASSGSALSTVTACAGRHLMDDTPVPAECSCYALESGVDTLFDTTQCYACKGEGVSHVWNVPSSSCVQPDFDPARSYAGSVFSAGPPRPLVHEPGREVVALWHTSAPHVTYETTTHVPGVWVVEHGDDGPPPLPALGNTTLQVAPAAPWDGNALVTQYAYNACIALGPSQCSTITWTSYLYIDVDVAYGYDGAPVHFTTRVVAHVDFTAYTNAFLYGTYDGTPPAQRLTPSTIGLVYDSLGGMERGYAPHDAFTLSPAVAATTDGYLVMCNNAGAQVGCGRVHPTANPHTLDPAVGDVFNPPWAAAACSLKVAHRTFNPQGDTCMCDWQLTYAGQLVAYSNDKRTEACGNCAGGLVRSPETGKCVTCIQAAGCDRNNTVQPHCTGDYHDYYCECAPGFDTLAGCARCSDNHVLVDGDTCVPCATYLGCSDTGTEAAECAYASDVSTQLVTSVCLCRPGFTGDDCGQCSAVMGMFRPQSGADDDDDDAPCVHARSWCGMWGVPDFEAGTCTCTHGRTGQRCDACDGDALCGTGGRCQTVPGTREWCICGPDALGVRAWWDDTPQSPCTACPPGHLPNDWQTGVASGCSEVDVVCPGVVDAAQSAIAGECRCLPGWAQRNATDPHSSCSVCASGYVGTECVSCTLLCGGAFWDTCSETPGNCTCGAGRAGPPCDGTCLSGFRRVTGPGVDTCVRCPDGCLDPHCVLDPSGRYTLCACPEGTTGDGCTVCAAGWVEATNTTIAPCVRCPPGGCLNGVCVTDGVCECLPGFDPSAQCATCISTFVLADSGQCRPCVGAGAACGAYGKCKDGGGDDDDDDGCLCDDGYAWSGGSCVYCDPRVTTGPLSGCVACPPDGCPIGSTCAGVPGPGGVGWVATCGCTAGLVRPTGATTGACSAPRGNPLTATGSDNDDGGGGPWYMSITIPTVLGCTSSRMRTLPPW